MWEVWTIIDWGLDYHQHERLLGGRLRVELLFRIEVLQNLEEYFVSDSDEYGPYEIAIPGEGRWAEAEFPLDLAGRKKRWELALQTVFPGSRL